jgi:hypothetical protein
MTNPLKWYKVILYIKPTIRKGNANMNIPESQEKVKHIFKHIFKPIIANLKGGDKRECAAEIALAYGNGGQTFAAEEFRMGRNTVRKGMREIESGEKIKDRYDQRGRKKTAERLPKLENDIKALLDSQSQADPKFQTDRLYTNMTIGEIRKHLIEQNGYADEDLPTNRTLNTIVNEMKYTLKTVKKTEPIKRIEETEFIFENLQRLHEEAVEDDNVVRLSGDAKDKVKVGKFSRGGKSRVNVRAYDHDFGSEYITPYGLMDVKTQETYIYLSETKATADFIVDALIDFWVSHGYAGSGKKLLLDLDNGPENSSHRTQFMKRLVEFSIDYDVEITLAYYPPYHSKYNPIERVWGVLEVHWGGALLDSKETIKKYIETATYGKKNLNAQLVGAEYESGVKLNKKTMKIYEKAIERIAGLEDYFVRISPEKCKEVLPYSYCYC